jgi:hypothetical protein
MSHHFNPNLEAARRHIRTCVAYCLVTTSLAVGFQISRLSAMCVNYSVSLNYYWPRLISCLLDYLGLGRWIPIYSPPSPESGFVEDWGTARFFSQMTVWAYEKGHKEAVLIIEGADCLIRTALFVGLATLCLYSIFHIVKYWKNRRGWQ